MKLRPLVARATSVLLGQRKLAEVPHGGGLLDVRKLLKNASGTDAPAILDPLPVKVFGSRITDQFTDHCEIPADGAGGSYLAKGNEPRS